MISIVRILAVTMIVDDYNRQEPIEMEGVFDEVVVTVPSCPYELKVRHE